MANSLRELYGRIKTSKHRWPRTAAGILLIAFGAAGFLPVLGFWMIPLGLTLLAIDWPLARRAHGYLLARWRRFIQKIKDRFQ